MRITLSFWAAFLGLAAVLVPTAVRAAEDADAFEAKVRELTQGSQVTVVHFWAPWCSNCKAELKERGWARFIEANPDVRFVFITVWNSEPGFDVLEANGVAAQANVIGLHHPNPSRKREDKLSHFLGLPVTWIPTTWVFRDGKLRFALNYGEVRFPLLQQLLQDTTSPWSH